MTVMITSKNAHRVVNVGSSFDLRILISELIDNQNRPITLTGEDLNISVIVYQISVSAGQIVARCRSDEATYLLHIPYGKGAEASATLLSEN